MAHEKERDLLKRLGSCRLNVKGKNTVEWDGSAIIPASLYRDLYDFLSTLSEEKEEIIKTIRKTGRGRGNNFCPENCD